MKYFCGIDIGKNGALCVIDENGSIIEKHKTPTIGANKLIDTVEFLSIIEHIRDTYNCGFYYEDLKPIFSASKKAVASLIGSAKMLEGILLALRLKHHSIMAKEWQAEMFKGIPIVLKDSTKINNSKSGKSKDTKAMALLSARRIWANESFKSSKAQRVEQDGIVDALLIADFARRKNM